MYTTVSMEAAFFLTCMLAGIAAAFVYDILRISRRIVKAGTVAVNLEDILFFVAAALMLFYAAFLKNSGEIRWHGFLGGGTGVALYIFVVRNRVVDIGTALVKWTMKAFVTVVRICSFPLRILFKALKKPISVVAWYTGRSVRRAKRVVRQTRARVKVRAKNAVLVLRKK